MAILQVFWQLKVRRETPRAGVWRCESVCDTGGALWRGEGVCGRGGGGARWVGGAKGNGNSGLRWSGGH
ncbi:uncharacterized [Tachysurus ichikawai]